jgi:outer membrane receptor protein involved in Fe transport
VAGDQFEQREQRTVMGGTLHHTWASQWGAREVTTMAGLQVRRDALDPVGLYGTVRRGRYATTREDRVREGTAGAYLENVVRWMPGLRTIVGARYDDYRFDVRSDDPRNSGVTRDHIVSPKAGAVLGPWARTELYANWGRGFHSNDARGATLSVDPGTGSPAGRVTPLVRSTGMELGLRARPLPDLEASLAAWQLDLASELVFAGDAGTTEASRPSRRRGIEWSVRYSAGQFRVDFDLSASRARFTDADPAGDYIPGAVDTVGSLALSAFDLGPWSGAFELRHFGPRPLIEDGSVRSKATTLANARISRRIGRDWRVSLDVFNLFDRAASDIDYYYVSRLPGEPAGGEPDIHFHPVEPRSLRLTATLRF